MDDKLCIILKIPYNFYVYNNDPRHHLLFLTIGQLIKKYILHIMGDTRESIEKMKNIASIYMNESQIHIDKTLYNIINNNKLNKILYLTPHMVIINPNNIKDSPLYIGKYEVKKINPKLISNIDPFMKKNSNDAVMKINSLCDAHILINDINYKLVLENYIKFNNIDTIKISCLAICNNKNDYNKIMRTIEFFSAQNHTNKELILICNTDSEKYLNKYGNKFIGIIYNNSTNMKTLKKLGCDSCTGDYIFKWNCDDWYHHAILSIFADNAIRANQDFISMSKITCYYDQKFYTSYEKFAGWLDIMMIKKDKIHHYVDCDLTEDNKILSMIWEKCNTFLLLECEYSNLYVKLNATSDILEVISDVQDYDGLIINNIIENNKWYNKIYKYFIN